MGEELQREAKKTVLNSILEGSPAPVVAPEDFVVCMGAALILGILLAWLHTYKNQATRNFILTLALLPVIVQTVIMMVNGNLGTGVAVMGAFSLVRFRSAPGNSREISSIFLAMAIGLAVGMGYLGAAAALLAVSGCMTFLVIWLPLGRCGNSERVLKITISEDLDYRGIFEELFSRYTSQSELMRIKTVNMGSLFELQYHIWLQDERMEKEFLDEVRCRNGNLPLVCGRIAAEREEL